MPRPEDTPPLGISIGEIVDRTTKIVQEEIELAKTEMAVAAQDLLRGSVAAIVGGVFAFFGLFVLLIAISFLVADAIGVLYPWLGFFIVAFICFAIGLLLALLALKKVKKGSQIVPTQAIDEAKQTREAVRSEISKDESKTIDSVAVEEDEPAATPVPPATKPPVAPAPTSTAELQPEPESTGDTADVIDVLDVAAASAAATAEEAFQEADAAEVDAKEAKRRAKQEAKEAREAEKAAKKAQAEAEKAEKLAAKRAAKAEKLARKQAERGAPEATAPVTQEHDVLGQPIQPQDYRPPHPPEEQPPAESGPEGKS